MVVQIVRDINLSSQTPLALTIGNFDGMHLGHRRLISRVCRRAQNNRWHSAVLTFEPHPLQVLGGVPVQRLGGVREKIQQLSAVDKLFLLRFTRQLSQHDGASFAALLFDNLRARYVAVGENFRFGRGRGGDVALLQHEGALRGAVVEGVSLQTAGELAISSGRIRQCLRDSDFIGAAALLGREWTISGRVVRGRGFGESLGYPTANLNLHFVPVCQGIFVAAARLDKDILPAAVSIGTNPTIDGGVSLVTEAHILDFDGDLYGRRLTLRLLHKLRAERRFDNMLQLRAAIGDDVEKTREWWERNKKMATMPFAAG